MRALLFLTSVLLLSGCDREERTVNSSEDKASLAQAPIIDRHAIGNGLSAPPLPDPSAPPPAPVESPPSSESRYRAVGTEPFWSVLVKGSTATLERPDRAAVHFAISRDDDGRTIRYLGDGFSMIVTDGPCSDGMSDATWADRVSIAFGEGTLKGCGGAREDF